MMVAKGIPLKAKHDEVQTFLKPGLLFVCDTLHIVSCSVMPYDGDGGQV